MVVAGLSWWQSWLCVWIGYFIAGAFVCLTGRIGATYHIGFPVVNRASFGIWGSLWPVFNRAAMGEKSCYRLCLKNIYFNVTIQRVSGTVFRLISAATAFIS